MKKKSSMTWSAEHKKYMTHEELGATITKPPKDWEKLFGAPPKPLGLKVVSIVYDWKLFTDGDYKRGPGSF